MEDASRADELDDVELTEAERLDRDRILRALVPLVVSPLEDAAAAGKIRRLLMPTSPRVKRALRQVVAQPRRTELRAISSHRPREECEPLDGSTETGDQA